MAEQDKKANTPSFFQGVKTEFKKIVWPSREQVMKQAVAVVAVAVVIGLVIAALDAAFGAGLNALMGL